MKKCVPAHKVTRNSVRGARAALTLGPLFFHWPPEKRRDFYFRMADEADIDVVYLGEAVCSKREPLFAKYEKRAIDRLERAGKQVVLSSPAIVASQQEMASIERKAASGRLVEANDLAAVQVLAGRPFVVGPFINVLNEGARDYLAGLGARRFVMASELSGEAVFRLAAPDGAKGGRCAGIETEVQVFGRQPLSVSMRCYAARAYGRNKDNCRFACSGHPDGLTANTLDGKPLFSVSGTSVMSHGCVVLLREMNAMKKHGVGLFRLSPHDCDMVKVANLYRSVLNGGKDPDSARASLKKITGSMPFINGFFHGCEGMRWISRRTSGGKSRVSKKYFS